MEQLPNWAKQLSERYYSGAFSTFVVHGNVNDLVLSEPPRGKRTYLPLQKFLQTVLFAQRDAVICYDRGGGLTDGHRHATPVGVGSVYGGLDQG